MTTLSLKNITAQTLGVGNGFDVEIIDLGITIFEGIDYIVDDQEFWEIKSSRDISSRLSNGYLQLFNATGVAYSLQEALSIVNSSQIPAKIPGSFDPNFLTVSGDTSEIINSNVYVDPITNNIGINTTSPQADLTLKGNLRIEGPTAGSTEIRVISGNDIIYNLPTSPGTTGQILSNTGNGNLQWVDNVSQQTDLVGSLFSYNFVYESNASNRWLCFNGDQQNNSNETPAVFPWKSQLVAIAFSNVNQGIGSDIEFYSVKQNNVVATRTMDFIWALSNIRTARKTNFSVPIIYDSGDKLSVYIRKRPGNTASKVNLICFFKIIEDIQEEFSENFSGNVQIL